MILATYWNFPGICYPQVSGHLKWFWYLSCYQPDLMIFQNNFINEHWDKRLRGRAVNVTIHLAASIHGVWVRFLLQAGHFFVRNVFRRCHLLLHASPLSSVVHSSKGNHPLEALTCRYLKKKCIGQVLGYPENLVPLGKWPLLEWFCNPSCYTPNTMLL